MRTTAPRTGAPGASLRGLDRRARARAWICAENALYRRGDGKMLRRSSRDTVDGSRPIARAISRTPCPPSWRRAISSRSSYVSCPPGSRPHLLDPLQTLRTSRTFRVLQQILDNKKPVNERRLKPHIAVLSHRDDGVGTLRAQLLTG